jgi:nucleoside-diphosphate-sugar epimerase
MGDRVLVTGACGFIGRVLCRQLRAEGCEVVGVTRRDPRAARDVVPEVTEWYQADFALPGTVTWSELVRGCDSIVHLAAKVHVLHDPTPAEIAAYRNINLESTVCLARAASEAAVARFVFVSSVKAEFKTSVADSNGPMIGAVAKSDPYGQSKRDAEQALLELVQAISLRLVILRPPLVYGPGVTANFARLLRLARWRMPLPFAAVRNARSLIFVDNLADAICQCRTHPGALGQVFPVCDTTLSTAELFRAISVALGSRTAAV